MNNKVLAVQRTTTGEIILVNKNMVFGRDKSSCDVALTHPSAARRHFQLNFDRGALVVQDLSGPPGTFLNGQRLSEDAIRPLSAGDRLTYGASPDEVFLVMEVKGGNDKLDKATKRIEWLNVECQRIRTKEGADGLSETQNRTLERYEGEIRKLEKSISDMINSKGGASVTEQDQFGGTDENESFWDVEVAEDTNSSLLDLTEKKSSANDKVETYESLLQKITDLDSESASLNSKIRQLQESQDQARADEEEDELDKFMAVNEKNIYASDLDKASKRLGEIKDERKRAEALAKLAQPALARMSASIKPSEAGNESSFQQPAPPSVSADTSSSQHPVTQQPPSLTKASQLFSRPTNQGSHSKFRVVQNQLDLSNIKRVKEEEEEDDKSGDVDSTWRPPPNQRGDGKTNTNSKYDY